MGSLTFVSQLLLIFGMNRPEFNLFIWTVGVTMFGGMVSTVAGLLTLYGYDQAYQVSVASGSNAATITAANSVMSAMETETVRGIVMGFILNRTLSRVAKHWWAAHMYLISDRQRKQAEEVRA